MAPLVAGKDLNAYAAAGIIADHESTIPEEALDKLSRGMYVMLREGTCSHDLANLSPMLLENPARARRCCFATDDRAPSDALSTGMIDNACRVAIEAGIDPVVAISMASLSTAEAFGLDHGCRDPHELRGAIAPGKRGRPAGTQRPDVCHGSASRICRRCSGGAGRHLCGRDRTRDGRGCGPCR